MINDLYASVAKIAERDPDQEVWSRSYGVIDAALDLAMSHLGGHPVAAEVRKLFSPDTVATGEPVRAVDLLPTLAVLRTLLGQETWKLRPQIDP